MRPEVLTGAAVLTVLAAILFYTCEGCALHHPVDVQPDYPPITETVHDAGIG